MEKSISTNKCKKVLNISDWEMSKCLEQRCVLDTVGAACFLPSKSDKKNGKTLWV